MRVLLSHCDFIEFKPIRKEVKIAEDVEIKSYRYEEILVAFTAIEKDDNEEKIEKMCNEIKIVANRIGINSVLIYPFAHLSNNLAKPEIAIRLIKLLGEKLKNENMKVYFAPFGWAKELHIKVKGHPLAESLRVI
ncbi:MAG: threonyl-tRNA synthetase editing domain-containing protein [Candidatus Aenigmatarchaeota archaeon]